MGDSHVTSTTTTKPGDKTKPFEFFIRRTFKAPRDRVWKAWTEAEQFGQWWGPKDFEVVSVTLDLRPGAMAHNLLRSPDGKDMWGRLLFREIVPQERLVFIVSFSDPKGGVSRHPLHESWPLHIFSTVSSPMPEKEKPRSQSAGCLTKRQRPSARSSRTART